MSEEQFVTSHPPLESILCALYGEDGDLYRVFKDEFGWHHNKFRSFLATFFAQCAYRVSSRKFYAPNGRISHNDLLKYSDYVEMWKQIGTYHLPDNPIRSQASAEEPFWA